VRDEIRFVARVTIENAVLNKSVSRTRCDFIFYWLVLFLPHRLFSAHMMASSRQLNTALACIPVAALVPAAVADVEPAVHAVVVEACGRDDVFNSDAVAPAHRQPALPADASCDVHLWIVRVQEGDTQVFSGTDRDARPPFEHHTHVIVALFDKNIRRKHIKY
jgi:hypothetical protein